MSLKEQQKSFREIKKDLVHISRKYQELKLNKASEKQLNEIRNQIKSFIHTFVSVALKTTKMIDLTQKEFKEILLKQVAITSPTQTNKKNAFFKFNQNMQDNIQSGEDIIINSLEYIWWQNKLMKLKHFKLIFKSLDRYEKGECYIADFQEWKNKIIQEGQLYISGQYTPKQNSNKYSLYTIEDAGEEEQEDIQQQKNESQQNFDQDIEEDEECSSDSISDELEQVSKNTVNQFFYKKQQFMKQYNKI